jgi:aspartate aminotransferase
MFLADRLQGIGASPTLAITAKAKELKAQGHDILSLGAGEPDFDTPDFIKEAAKIAIDKGLTKYTAVDGIVELKRAIQKKLQDENHLSYALNEIIVSSGAKQAIFNAFCATLNAGDEVIIPAPYWVSYEAIVAMMGGTSIIVACTQAENFKLTAKTLEAHITPKTKWLILNTPSNPTGVVYTKEELESLADVLRRHPHVHVMSDDIYEHVIYAPHRFYSIPMIAPDLKDRTLTINGVSKSFSMTGWRIGYAAGEKTLIEAINNIQSQSTSNACSISQYASLAALTGDNRKFFEDAIRTFQERRDFVVQALNAIPGMSCQNPEGAFYVYPSCASFIGSLTPDGKPIETDSDFSTYLLEHALVAVVPGIAFGLSPHFRISYATDMETLKEACERIAKACGGLKS